VTQIDHAQPVLPSARVGQATVVEQTRAAAEVAAAVQVAQQCPRSMQAAIAEMERSCSQAALADRAFFRFPRGGQSVSGPSIYLARELARCFGNVQYGIAELSRDDELGQSEMIAFAWDVERNTRNSSTFIVPHKRDKRGGPEKLVDLRDIYENNANQGARRVREAIFAVLPPWFVEQAKELCNKTLAEGGGVPLPKRIADAVKAFEGIGVTVDQLAQNVGRPVEKWTEHDVAKLGITYKSIQRGEIRAEEEFPPPRVTTEEITGRPVPPPAEPADPLSYSDDEVAEGGGQR
jgi:hypothetical protein